MAEKIKISVYLHPDLHERAKTAAKERFGAGRHMSDWVADTIAAILANPGVIDPTKPPSESDQILQKLKKAQIEQLKEQESVTGEIVDRLERLELKFDSMMKNFDVEQPTKDHSGKRVFDDKS